MDKINKKALLFLLYLITSQCLIFCTIFFIPATVASETNENPIFSTQNNENTWVSRYFPQNNTSIIYEHNVSQPFGVNGGDVENRDLQQNFSIEWNRNILDWNSIEKYNGSFTFNGHTVVNETYTGAEINGTIVHLRHYSFDPDTEITAYYDWDTTKAFNLVTNKINSTAFQIGYYLFPNDVILVSYNKTFATQAPYLEKYITNNYSISENNSVRNFPVFDFSNKYLFDEFKTNYSSAGYNSDTIISVQPDYIPLSAVWNWVRYINETVNRYKNYVHAWEIGDQPNNIYSSDQWDTYLYNITLKAAMTIKTIDPTAKIYIGGLGENNELEFLQAIFDKLLNNPQHPEYRDYFDGITFQSNETIPEKLISDKLNSYLNILNENHWTPSDGKEFIITDAGVPTSGTMANPYGQDNFHNQASDIVKSMTIAADLGASLFIWNCYQDNIYGTKQFNGIFDNNLNPKLGAYAFNITSYLLSNSIARRGSLQFHFEPSLYLPNNHIYGYDFRQSDGTEVIILWNNYRVYLNTTLEIPGGLQRPVYQYSYVNDSKTMLMAAGFKSDQLNFQIGYDPIIITFQPYIQQDHIRITIIGDSYMRFIVWVEPGFLMAMIVGTIIYFSVKRSRR